MKTNMFSAVLLFSVICFFISAPLSAQTTDKKQVKVKTDLTKDNVKKDNLTKDNVTKDNLTKDNIKKDEVKKDVIINDTRTMDVKKDITTKKEETSKGSHDKIIGKTKDGRVVFEGPRGGHYYLTEKGTKVYIKKGVKI